MKFNTPVAFIVFNRPDLTAIVFEAIRKAKPSKLLVIADGPRFEAEIEKCSQVRTIIESIDWPCEVLRNYSNVNMGCKARVSSGITWVFEQVDEAIILEDDCLPHPSFFNFCQTMLSRYRMDDRVMHIAGVNFQNGIQRGDGSYYFSKYSHIWGWATWKRAWKHYDVTMSGWLEFSESKQFGNWCFNEKEHSFWKHILDLTYNGSLDTWDYQWTLTIIRNNGYCLMPNANLISNIGFREDATHTIQYNPDQASQDTFEYQFPDKISAVTFDLEADKYTYDHSLNPATNNIIQSTPSKDQRSIFFRVKNKIRRILNT